MAVVPKRKTSKQRKALRRSHHALDENMTTPCANCKQLILPHRACEFCGFYKGKKIIKVAKNDKSK
ncbi:large subunit ribosomal protein L32 [Metamycoplasma subdolum]|uniref:Large ribosomal subunit protein bL32 n=1 Tax=Metamycoplasma subdolum TaxID=92407 RepID=A0A3M0AH89_9BACT|nr:50S ribosomal protein L32 [Metamycoplasma subdolum]RMA78602.1 large subunit ribosomal protein L32 [Metamycoplasma subdolum]WPB50262.1 50S ribosomal protein L32 [Metamycoplasma subdolum]